MIGPDMMIHSKRWDLIHRFKLFVSKMLCSIEHRGPIVGNSEWKAIVGTNKMNKENRPLKGFYWKRKCNRYGCAEIYTRIQDKVRDND
jgi:hypothetical protein